MLGYLAQCADRRFHRRQQKEFEKKTGLASDDYWIEARAGGAPAIKEATTADYAYEHGARVMGWAAHGSHCGGWPGKSDQEIETMLEKTIEKKKKQYPKAKHLKIFSVEPK